MGSSGKKSRLEIQQTMVRTGHSRLVLVLPVDCLLHMGQWLHQRDMASLSQTCREMCGLFTLSLTLPISRGMRMSLSRVKYTFPEYLMHRPAKEGMPATRSGYDAHSVHLALQDDVNFLTAISGCIQLKTLRLHGGYASLENKLPTCIEYLSVYGRSLPESALPGLSRLRSLRWSGWTKYDKDEHGQDRPLPIDPFKKAFNGIAVHCPLLEDFLISIVTHNPLDLLPFALKQLIKKPQQLEHLTMLGVYIYETTHEAGPPVDGPSEDEIRALKALQTQLKVLRPKLHLSVIHCLQDVLNDA